MPIAHAVALELRQLADSLDASPDAEITAPTVAFYHWGTSGKDKFLSVCKLLPRPLKKTLTNDYGNGSDIHITYSTPSLTTYASIAQKATCTLVEPARKAVYRCDPILSDDEEETISA